MDFLKSVSRLTKLLVALALNVSCAFSQTNIGDGVFYASISSALPMDTPILFGGNNAPSTTTTQYIAPQSYGSTTGWGTTESAKRLVMPIAGTLKNLYIQVSGTNTTGDYTFTVYHNGAPTSLGCVIGVGVTTCNDTSDTITIAAGDTISLENDPNSPDALLSFTRATLLFRSTSPKESLVLGAVSSGNIAATSILYFPIQGVSIGNATQALTSSAIPTNGEISNLYVDMDGSPDAGTYDITVMHNSVATALTVNIADPSTSASNLVNTINVVPGDLIGILITQADVPTPRNIRWGVRFKPTINGESLQLFGSTSLGTSSSTQYQGVAGGVGGLINSTESTRIQLIQACEVRKMYLDVVTAVGAGNSVAFTVRKNAADTAITATISGAAATTANDTTNTATYAAGDNITMKLVKSAGMPAGDGVHTGAVTYIAP